MKKISDANRFSILQEEMTHCFICRKNVIDKHEIFGGINRQKSKAFGLVVALCREHHEEAHKHGSLDMYLKQVGQKAFEEKYQMNFLNVFGVNYK